MRSWFLEWVGIPCCLICRQWQIKGGFYKLGRDDFFSPDERKSDRKALLPNPMQPLAEFIEHA